MLSFLSIFQVATLSVGTFFIVKNNTTTQNKLSVLEDELKDASRHLNNYIKTEQHIIELKNKANNIPMTSSEYINSQIKITKEKVNNLNSLNIKDFDENNLTNLILKVNKVNDDFKKISNNQALLLYKDNSFENYKNDFLNRYEKELQNNNFISIKDYEKNWLLYKLKQLKEFWSTPNNLYLQPQKRLEFLVENYENNYNEDVFFQWGVGDDNMWGLNPTKFKGFQIEIYSMNDENIAKWIKHYEQMKWVKVDKENQIDKITKDNVDVFKTPQKIKNNIIKEYVNRMLDFNFIKWSQIWDLKNENEYLEIVYEDKEKFKDSRTELINELNKEKNIYANFGFENYKSSKSNKEFFIYLQAKNFDFDKYFDYAKEPSKIDFNPNIYGINLYEKANFFEDIGLNDYIDYIVKVDNSKTTYTYILGSDGINKKKSYNITKIDKNDSILTSPKNIAKINRVSKNPIPYFKKWMKEWMDVLPKIINKNWSDEQKIKAVSYYILTNSTYLNPYNSTILDNYNSDGHNFISPLSFFGSDRQIQCNGYASNLSMALTLLNIPVRTVGGYYFGSGLDTVSSGEHAWNEVFLGGRWKAIDLTNWDRWETTYHISSIERLKKAIIFSEWDDREKNPLIMERNSDHMKKFRLDISSYVSTILKYQNPSEYEYEELPTTYKLNDEIRVN